MTTMPAPAPEFTRRLLKLKQVADKLSTSASTFVRQRTDLEGRGFPPPVFGGGTGSTLRWDERAIDLWLDLQLPAGLRTAAVTHKQAAEKYEIAARLKDRARELAI